MSLYAYSFVERMDTENWVVKINEGPYEGVCYEYGAISAKINEEDDIATLSFKFNIKDYGDNCSSGLEDEEDFNNSIGDILQDIIYTSFEEKQKQ